MQTSVMSKRKMSNRVGAGLSEPNYMGWVIWLLGEYTEYRALRSHKHACAAELAGSHG